MADCGKSLYIWDDNLRDFGCLLTCPIKYYEDSQYCIPCEDGCFKCHGS